MTQLTCYSDVRYVQSTDAQFNRFNAINDALRLFVFSLLTMIRLFLLE